MTTKMTAPDARIAIAGNSPPSMEYVRWFNDLARRVGGIEALSNTELKALWDAYEANGAPVAVQEEGVTVGIARRLNFIGAAVTVTLGGTTANIDIPGLAAFNEVEVDLGAIPKRAHRFTVSNAGISVASKIQVLPCGRPATGRGSDDWEWDGATFAALPAAGSALVWAKFSGLVAGKRMIQYAIG